MHSVHWPALVTLGIAVLLFVNAANVGRQRGRYRIDAPHTSGHPMLERAFRVQMNTIENTVLMLPVMWLFALYLSGVWAAVLGALWLAARIWYGIVYMQEPKCRGPAFGTSMLLIAAMMLGALWGVGRVLLG
ncbi:MAG: MAPEG family protein [Rhodocyclaceae bacterium]|nr:MAPEG family protein [Rhodocyclaceae bacterium]